MALPIHLYDEYTPLRITFCGKPVGPRTRVSRVIERTTCPQCATASVIDPPTAARIVGLVRLALAGKGQTFELDERRVDIAPHSTP